MPQEGYWLWEKDRGTRQQGCSLVRWHFREHLWYPLVPSTHQVTDRQHIQKYASEKSKTRRKHRMFAFRSPWVTSLKEAGRRAWNNEQWHQIYPDSWVKQAFQWLLIRCYLSGPENDSVNIWFCHGPHTGQKPRAGRVSFRLCGRRRREKKKTSYMRAD